MAASMLSHGNFGAVPEELRAAVVYEAKRDAELTARFLNCLFSEFERRFPESGPAGSYRGLFGSDQLLALGAALRVLRWEQSGLLRPFMGLPSAKEAVAESLQSTRFAKLADQVVSIFTEHFSWLAAEECGVDLLVEIADEDALAQKLAEFIWANRGSLRNQCNEQKSNETRKSSTLSPSRKRRKK